VNQKRPDLGIPNRFDFTSSRSNAVSRGPKSFRTPKRIAPGFLSRTRTRNKRYAPVLTEMRLRLELTRNQPHAAATIAPLAVAMACERREPPVRTCPLGT
jgi:hypothetical protein